MEFLTFLKHLSKMSAARSELASLFESFSRSEKTDEQKNIIEQVADTLVKDKTTKILNIVESLGVYLTNPDISQRRKGTQFLAELVHRLPPDLLADQEIDLLTLFFCDRLQDHHSIQPQVIYGLLGMISYYNLTDALVIKMCQTIFAEVHVQSLSQADRRNTFNLFSNLLDKNVRALRRMGADFVLGFIQSMDGEKDPRNLLVCFKDVEKIVAELPFDIFTEDLFEVTSCYFPIDFTPPSNDPFGVTRDDLVSSLRDCLSSTEKFAEFLLPLLLEKLSSDIVDAKMDSLLTLAASVLKYGPAEMKNFSEDVWNAVRRDFLLGGLKSLENACANAIRNIIKCLEPEPETCANFIHLILRDCEHSLKDPDLAIAEQLGMIMQTVAFATLDAFDIAIPRIMENIVTLLNMQENSIAPNIIKLLGIVNSILDKALSNNDYPALKLQNPIRDKLSSFLLTTISTTHNGNLQAVLLNTLLAMNRLNLLLENEVKIFMDFTVNQISKDTNSIVLDMCCKCISVVCSENLEPEKGYLSDKLKHQVLEILEKQDENAPMKHHRLKIVCKALTKSFSSSDGLKEIVAFLVENSLSNGTTDFVLLEILHSIGEIVADNPSAATELGKLLLSPLLNNISKSSAESSLPSEAVYAMTEILLILISNLPLSEQENQAKLALSFYTKHYNNSHDDDKMEVDGVNEVKCNMYGDLLVVYALLSGLYSGVNIPEINCLLDWFKITIESCKVKRIADCGYKTYASVINKMEDGEKMDSVLENTLKYVETVLESENMQPENRENIAMLLLWLCKAVILRWHKATPNIISKLLHHCHNEKIGKDLCDNFSILVQDFLDCLNAKTHARMKIMYKQRFVEFILPKLVDEYKKANENAKGRFLKAISHLLEQLPKPVLQKKISPLMPLLIRSLTFADTDILSSTLATITALDAPDVIKEHVTSLVPRLLSLTGFQSLSVRMAAVQCLASLCRLPSHVIYPYQKKVIRTLKGCLDDKKRFVRKEAMKCRSQWYLLKETA